MPKYFRHNIVAMTGYVPGEQPGNDGVIKLNTNENPYGPSPKVYATLKRAVNSSLRLYPEPQSDTLRTAAARLYGVKPGNIIVGNGSDEILSMLLRCFVGPGDRVAYPVPTYSLYDTLVEIQDGSKAAVNYPANFSLPAELAEQNAALTFVCNPNAPSLHTSDFTPQALELAHVNPRGQIADWLKQQQSKPSATTTVGDWTVEFSTEADTDQPGAILTLTDKLCKVDCGAE